MNDAADDTPQSLFKDARKFMEGTFLSRVTGLLREIIMAYVFGANAAVGAFYVAFRWANFFRRFFGEGALLSGFVPYYESMRKEGVETSSAFVRDLSWTLLVFFLPFLLLLECGLYTLAQHSSWKDILYLTMTMIPGLLFLTLHTIASALLQCEKRFFLPSFSPVALNVTWMVTALLLRHERAVAAMPWLSVGIFLGYFFQWLLVWPPAWASVIRKKKTRLRLFSPKVRKMLPAFSLSLLGVGATQINSAIDALFAHISCDEGPAYLNYALRIQQLPIGLFTIAITSALLPPLSRAHRNDNLTKFHELLQYACKKTIFLLIPSTIGCFFLAIPTVNLLYGHGSFDAAAISGTTRCLWGYGIGLLPISFAVLLAPVYYASHNYRIPTIAAVVSVLANICLNTLFILRYQWGPESVAWATSLAAIVQLGILWTNLPIEKSRPLTLLPSFGQSLGFASMGLCAVWLCLRLFSFTPLFRLSGPFPTGFFSQFFEFTLEALCFSATYLGLWFASMHISTYRREAV